MDELMDRWASRSQIDDKWMRELGDAWLKGRCVNGDEDIGWTNEERKVDWWQAFTPKGSA